MKVQVRKAVIGGLVLLAASAVSCMPNIRIQVNNENLQNPPYLLEALRQIDSSEPLAAAGSNQSISSSGAASAGANSAFNVVKEETIEEILDLEPDSVLKLSPDNVSSSFSPQDHAKLQPADQSANAESASLVPNLVAGGKVEPAIRPGAQLPVTSSHLKRPANVLDEENSSGGSGGHIAAGSMLSESRASMESDDEAAALASAAFSTQTGPKSRISASVAPDEGPAVVNLDRKPAGQQPPDTLEPSQVMEQGGSGGGGIANGSQVPATVTRQYGANSRTRITLGGGYVRNKSPAPAGSNESQEAARPQESAQTAAHASSTHDNSRLIEVPERIVLPASVFSQQQQTTVRDKFLLLNVTTDSAGGENQAARQPLGRPDPRCPKSGSSTFEDPAACDKYFYCEQGHISQHVCPNGLMYGTRNLVKDSCVHRWEAVCGEKSVPNPISSPGCRWQWGIFSVQGSPKCTPDFYECREGLFEVRKCAVSGQVYDDRTKSCRFAEQVGCLEEALADFKCPPDDQGNTYWPFPRYFLNERALIHCINDKPAIVRCRDHERVDPEHLHCVAAKSSASQGSPDEGGPSERSLREQNKKAEKSQH